MITYMKFMLLFFVYYSFILPIRKPQPTDGNDERYQEARPAQLCWCVCGFPVYALFAASDISRHGVGRLCRVPILATSAATASDAFAEFLLATSAATASDAFAEFLY